MKLILLLVIAIAIGVAIAYIDSRPNWDDTGITAGMLLVSSLVLGFVDPPHAWISALAIGIWIPAHEIFHGRGPLILLVLGFAFGGAYAGALLRKLAFPR